MNKIKLSTLVVLELAIILLLSTTIGGLVFYSDLSSLVRERFSRDLGFIRPVYLSHRNEILNGFNKGFEQSLFRVVNLYEIERMRIEYSATRKTTWIDRDLTPLAAGSNEDFQNCNENQFVAFFRSGLICYKAVFTWDDVGNDELVTLHWWVKLAGLSERARSSLLVCGLIVLLGLLICAFNWFLFKKMVFAPIASGVGRFENWVKTGQITTAKPGGLVAQEISEMISQVNQLMVLSKDYQQVREKTIRLEATEEAAKQVAHDLRSPLTALRVALDVLKRSPSDEAGVMAGKAYQRINDIISTLSSPSILKNWHERLNEQNQPTRPTGFIESEDIHSHVAGVVAEHRLQLRGGTEIIYSAFDSAVFAKVDSVEFKRAISNLINNSIEAFSQPGFAKPKGLITVSLLADEAEIKVTIKDNGPGIASELLPKLGQKGFSFGKRLTANSGTGLGVYHAKKTIEAFKGRIEFSSELGSGALVTVSLPRSEKPEWYAEDLVLKPKIVIVDDDESFQRLWIPFAKLGHEVFFFSNHKDFKAWKAKQISQTETTYLIDYDFGPWSPSGLELISDEKLGGSSTYLVTSQCEDFKVRQQSIQLDVKIFSKERVPSFCSKRFARTELSFNPDPDLL